MSTSDLPEPTSSQGTEAPSSLPLLRRLNETSYFVKLPIIAIALWLVLVLLIQLAAPNNVQETMPLECPIDSQNCVRIAADGASFRADGLQSPVVNGSIWEARDVIQTWLVDGRGGTSLYSSSETSSLGAYMHGVDRTNFLFFPDDLYVLSECADDGHSTKITLQSKSRLGVSDLGVNHDRLSELVSYLESYQWSGADCIENPP